MSVELSPGAAGATGDLAAALHPGGVYCLVVELQLSPGGQRAYCTARKQIGHEVTQSVQFESSVEQSLVVLSAVDAALTAVHEVHLQEEQWQAPSARSCADDEQAMEEDRVAAGSPVQVLYVHVGSSELSAGTGVRMDLADHELDLLRAFACAPDGWLSIQEIIGVFGQRGRQVQRHIVELRMWRLRRKIQTLGALEAGLHFEQGKGYQMGLPICMLDELGTVHQAQRAGDRGVDESAVPLVLHEQALRLQYQNRWVDIQAHEAVLLAGMSRAALQRLTHAEVLGLYGWPDDLQHRKAAEVRLVRLRKKIVELGLAAPAIKAVRKVGYQLCFAIQLVEVSDA